MKITTKVWKHFENSSEKFVTWNKLEQNPTTKLLKETYGEAKHIYTMTLNDFKKGVMNSTSSPSQSQVWLGLAMALRPSGAIG